MVWTCLRNDDYDWVKNVLLWRLREPEKELGPRKLLAKYQQQIRVKIEHEQSNTKWV